MVCCATLIPGNGGGNSGGGGSSGTQYPPTTYTSKPTTTTATTKQTSVGTLPVTTDNPQDKDAILVLQDRFKSVYMDSINKIKIFIGLNQIKRALNLLLLTFMEDTTTISLLHSRIMQRLLVHAQFISKANFICLAVSLLILVVAFITGIIR